MRVARSVPILTYHSLDASGSVISVGAGQFGEHLAVLRDKGFAGIALRELIDGWEGKAALPDRPVAITFDDGFVNVLEHGVPALRAVGFRATIYAVAGRLGMDNGWPTQPAGIPRLPLMTAGQLRECDSAGMEVGAHTVSHARLDVLAEAEAEQEIVGSRRALEEVLGRGVETFAHTYGLANAHTRRVAAREFRASVSVEMGVATCRDPREFLPRLDVYYLRDPRVFRRFGTPLGNGYLWARRLGRSARGVLVGGRP